MSDQAVQRYAGFELRLVAFLLDLIVLFSFLMLFVAAIVLLLLLSSDGGVEDPPDSALYAAAVILLVYLFPFSPLYFWAMWVWRGQTVGKMAMAIKIVRRDRTRVGPGTAALRLVGYLFSTLLFFGGFLMVPFDRERRGLHDRLADTVVLDLT